MNKIINIIKNIDDDFILDRYVKYRINSLSKESLNNNVENDTLGSIVGINSYEDKGDFLTIDAYVGYIPYGKRIVYGAFSDEIKRFYCKGQYYYLDDEGYIYDFARFIRKVDIININELITAVYDFLTYYLDIEIGKMDREVLHQLILENSKSYFKPVYEHSISDFYGNGAARCSEYGVMGQNILSFIGIESYVLFDTEHVYNVIKYDDSYYLLDFSNTVGLFDIELNYIRTLPFFTKLTDFGDNELQIIMDRKKALELDDYDYVFMGSKIFEMYKSRKRKYACGGTMIKEEKIKIYGLGEEVVDDNTRIILPDDENEKGKGIVLK